MSSSVTGKEPRNFLSMLAIFLLALSILVSGGVYLYKSYLIKQEQSLSGSLSKNRDSFEKDTIEELELFNKRTETAKKILSNHITVSALFSRLGEITIPSVQYNSFDYSTNANGFTVSMKGLAKDYRSIALQSDAFNTTKGRSFKNVLFSDLMKDKNNNISFSLKFDVDPTLLSYEKNINNNEMPTSPQVIVPVNEVETPTLPITNNN